MLTTINGHLEANQRLCNVLFLPHCFAQLNSGILIVDVEFQRFVQRINGILIKLRVQI